MAYIENNLRNDEHIEFVTQNSKIAHTYYVLLCVMLIAIFPLGMHFWLSNAEKALSIYTSRSLQMTTSVLMIPAVLGASMLISLAVRLKNTEAAITNKKTIAKKGFFTTIVDEIPHTKLQSISVKQTFFGRIFNYGNVYLTGNGFARCDILNIKRPQDFKNELNRLFDEEEDY
jgi:uncharacterized membrane protein YdbT with pleckstrin-like domain